MAMTPSSPGNLVVTCRRHSLQVSAPWLQDLRVRVSWMKPSRRARRRPVPALQPLPRPPGRRELPALAARRRPSSFRVAVRPAPRAGSRRIRVVRHTGRHSSSPAVVAETGELRQVAILKLPLAEHCREDRAVALAIPAGIADIGLSTGLRKGLIEHGQLHFLPRGDQRPCRRPCQIQRDGLGPGSSPP